MLDTNMASYIVRGANAGVMNRLDKVPPEQLCVSAITQGELLYGLARKPGATALQNVVRAFLMRVEVLPWGSPAATRYGLLRAELNAAGKPLGNNDMLIAAHALAENAVLVSNDLAFGRVPGLALENWAPG